MPRGRRPRRGAGWRVGVALLALASSPGAPALAAADRAVASPLPARPVNVSVDVGRAVRVVDERVFGLNAAIWDGELATPGTVSLLAAAGTRALRFPGGSLSDEYHWRSNTTGEGGVSWPTDFDDFAAVATALDARVYVTVNYGTGSPEEAADWIAYANVAKRLGFEHWEIGNESYGSWEADAQPMPHDPVTYAVRARDYLAAMKAADLGARVGVVVVTGEDSYANYASRSATNPRTGQVHHGWTPVLLATLRSLSVTPDFVIYHRYEQGPGQESDGALLQSARTWPADAANLRLQLTDYLGEAGAGVEIAVTESNSVWARPGKQTTSLVNGLFLADSIGNVLQTEIAAYLWWDVRNAQEFSNNNAPSLYGWRGYGDYGVISTPSSGGSETAYEPYPTYHVLELLSRFARGGDVVVAASSDYPLLAVFATHRRDGSLALLVVNKSRTEALTADVHLAGFVPAGPAAVVSYGVAQDEAARTGVGSPDLAESTLAPAGARLAATFAPYSATVIAVPGAPTPRPARRLLRHAAGRP